MTERRCGTCRWHDQEGYARYHGPDAEGLGNSGFCRRFPPMPDFIRRWHIWQKTEQSNEPMENLVFGIWPETDFDDWCGEWQAREPPAP